MNRFTPGTVGSLQEDAARRLAEAGIDTARLDARVLVGHALGRDDGWLLGHRADAPSRAGAERVEALLARRCAREPLAYILGRKEFWSLDFAVTPATLIPRPETETVVAAVLAHVPERAGALRMLDLGTGSGCLLLAVLHELPGARGVAVDRSAEALAVARANAANLGLSGRAAFAVGDWWRAPVDGPFDVVLSNPPYVADAEMDALAPEIAAFEPADALRAGPDGLDCYRRILPGLAGRLRPGGLFAGEIGWRQGDAVSAMARAAGLERVEVLADGAGLDRCVLGWMGGTGKS